MANLLNGLNRWYAGTVLNDLFSLDRKGCGSLLFSNHPRLYGGDDAASENSQSTTNRRSFYDCRSVAFDV